MTSSSSRRYIIHRTTATTDRTSAELESVRAQLFSTLDLYLLIEMIKEERLESGTATQPSNSVTIDVVELTYGVVVNKKVKRLLKNVSLSLSSGTMCCLMVRTVWF